VWDVWLRNGTRTLFPWGFNFPLPITNLQHSTLTSPGACTEGQREVTEPRDLVSPDTQLIKPQEENCACPQTLQDKTISGFRRDVLDIGALLGYYAAWSGKSLPKFRDNLSAQPSRLLKTVPKRLLRNYHYTLSNIPEEHRSHIMKALEDSGGKVTLHEVACCSHFTPGEVSEEPTSILRVGFSWNLTNHLPG
jgi:hypothetical protein